VALHTLITAPGSPAAPARVRAFGFQNEAPRIGYEARSAPWEGARRCLGAPWPCAYPVSVYRYYFGVLPLLECYPPRQKSRVERLKAKVELPSTYVTMDKTGVKQAVSKSYLGLVYSLRTGSHLHALTMLRQVCACVCAREKECVCVCVCLCVFVCVREREREGEKLCECEYGCVCVFILMSAPPGARVTERVCV